MKALTTTSGNFGPYRTIEDLEDRYRCNGNADLPKTVVGQGEIVEADTITWPEPPAPPVPVPQSVTMRQARLALLAAGLLDDVEAAVVASGRAAQIEWEYATEVTRDHLLIASVQNAQGLSDTEIDALFVAAEKV